MRYKLMRCRLSILVASVLTGLICVAVPGQQRSSAAAKTRSPGPFVIDGINTKDVDEVASDIRAIDLDGLKKILQREPGDTRPLLLNFWATWCDPCREEFPDLVKLDGDYKGKPLNFIAVSLDDITDIKSEVPKFLNQMKATMPVVLLNVKDQDAAINAVDPNWRGEMPATFLFDKDGKIVFRHFGKVNPDELRAAIDKEVSRKQ
ncbi:MAG TPA: TlpA disulfide reductase family protein [Pyrinomonadaceae bacterium]|nr:TlpA disulfide reductase family protein [Pyrinomonadaceae bacterium]